MRNKENSEICFLYFKMQLIHFATYNDFLTVVLKNATEKVFYRLIFETSPEKLVKIWREKKFGQKKRREMDKVDK